MKTLIASLICLSVFGCASTQQPFVQPANVVSKAPAPIQPTKGQMVEGSVVIVEVVEVEVQEEMNPQDYERLSSLIHREVRGKCMCTSGDPFCTCKVKPGPKRVSQE